MFKLDPDPTFWATVSIYIPGKGVGKFDVEYRHLSGDARQAYVDGLKEKTNLDALFDIVIGWRGVDRSFNKESLEKLLNDYPAAAAALFRTFWDELSGASEKN